MAHTSRGLGKGLDALLKGFNEQPTDVEVKTIPVASIVPNPFQPRKEFSEEALAELAESIRNQGVLQPILVRTAPDSSPGHFELVAGERRLRAAKMAGLQDIPCLVRELDDEQSLTIAIVENLQREDLNIIEEALGLKQLQDRLNLSQEDLARKVGKSRPAVANTLRLLQLPDHIINLVMEGQVSGGHARSLLGVTDSDSQEALLAWILEYGVSVRQVEEAVSYWKENGELPSLDGGGHAPARKKKKPMKAAETPRELHSYASRISEEYQFKVSISGSEDTGRISIRYSSREQLDIFLKKLGVS